MLSNVLSRLAAFAAGSLLLGTSLPASSNPGAVFTSTNASDGNRIVVFARAWDGALAYRDTFPTGGFGTGAGLGNQGALVLSANHQWLFAVNAGSSEVSVFEVAEHVLVLRDIVPSGGTMPISVSVNSGLVYVLNAGDAMHPGNISGFMFAHDTGRLIPLAGSTRPLSTASAGPAQIGINPWANLIVVTEKATNKIVTYTLDGNGLPSAPIPQASNGATPFGFAFDRWGRLYVSEAFGGIPGASAISSYIINTYAGTIHTLSASVPTLQTAACWVALEENGKWNAFTTNTGSSSISGFYIQGDGTLLRSNPDGMTAPTGPGSSPIDLAFSHGSEFLYALNAGSNTITAYRALDEGLGGLEQLGTVAWGLPAGANGLAAY